MSEIGELDAWQAGNREEKLFIVYQKVDGSVNFVTCE